MAAPAAFIAIDRVNAAEAVQRQLSVLIESGNLKSGEKLPSENELARLFGVSRPIVREALGSLRAVGLIVSHNGRGSFVTSSASRWPRLQGRYSFEHLYDIRSLLEISNAGLAAERHVATDINRLGQIVEAMELEDDREQWVKHDADFHIAVSEAAGNPIRTYLVEQLRSLIVEQSGLMIKIEGRIARANREHQAVYAAVRTGDARSARHSMKTHLRNAYYGR